jgi:hypothetical protein
MSLPSLEHEFAQSTGISGHLRLFPALMQIPLYSNQYAGNLRLYDPRDEFDLSLTESSPVESADHFVMAVLDDPTLLARMVMNMKEVTGQTTDFEQQALMPDDQNTTSFEGAAVTLETLQFCGTNSLVAHLTEGIKMARKHFSSVVEIEARLESDPEDHDQYVVLRVTSPRNASVDLEAYFKYCEEWSASVEWPLSRMILLDFNSATADDRYGI